jgi:cell division septation protein DedD
MSDEGFHEIQLNGKQLVFLFMAATVVSVVIFLCGVMVGRGVRAERGPEAVVDAASSAPAAAAEAPPPGPVTPAPAKSSGSEAPPAAVEPPPPADDGPVDRPGTPAAAPPAAAAAPASKSAAPATDKPAAKAETPPAEKKTEPPSLGPVDQSGWAVQVSAVRDRGEADTMARQLVAKGYQAYVLAPGAKGSPMFKVQIGRFKTRQEAEKTAARVKKEGKYKPWITR